MELRDLCRGRVPNKCAARERIPQRPAGSRHTRRATRDGTARDGATHDGAAHDGAAHDAPRTTRHTLAARGRARSSHRRVRRT
eukprot:7391395-Prymnesium_polylepis.1